MTLLRREASQGAALPQLTLAEILRLDLLARELPAPSLGECEAIVARLLDRAQADRADDAPPRRCDTREVDLDNSCMACGAVVAVAVAVAGAGAGAVAGAGGRLDQNTIFSADRAGLAAHRGGPELSPQPAGE